MSEKFSSMPFDQPFHPINSPSKSTEAIEQPANYVYDNVQHHLSSGYLQYSSTTNYYNSAPAQSVRSQMGMYQENVDFSNWDTRNISDKVELVELTNKDLSPAMEMLMPDCYKSSTRDANLWNHVDCNPGSNGYQKSYDLPSCAQVNGANYDYDKNKYCNIQKTHEFDAFLKTYTYNNDLLNDGNDQSYRAPKTQEYNPYNNYYETNLIDSIENGLFQDCMPFEPIMEQQTDADEDEESDIVVEESEEDCGGEERIYDHMNKCVICNMIYTLHGRQFYLLTMENPLTMTTQRPVLVKVIELVGKLGTCQNYLCSECLQLINTVDHLQLKLKTLSGDLLGKFQNTCRENNVTFETKGTETRGKFECRNRRYKCRTCKKVLSMRKVFQLHSKRHRMSGFLCELCGKMFDSRMEFYRHASSKRCSKFVPKIKAFKCSRCLKAFRTKTNLKEHENSCLGLLPYVCTHEKCDKKFASSTKLKKHVKLKHEKKFTSICSICNIGFINVSEYKTHMLSHSTEKKYTCTKCNKSYKTPSNLNFHMKVHNDKMPFNCTICKKGFLRKDYLEAHMNNHNGIKNYVCSVCDKKFVCQKNLDSHMKYHDGTVRKNTCNICGKTMITGFQEHLRIHNNLLEFQCDFCDLRFNTKIALAKHKKKKHNKEK